MWSSVLRALPSSRLLVKARPFADAEMRKKFLKKFERQGISSDRIDTMALIPSCADHLMVKSSSCCVSLYVCVYLYIYVFI